MTKVEKECKIFAEESVENDCKEYLEQLKRDAKIINSSIVENFNSFKHLSQSLMFQISINSKVLNSKKLVKELTELYIYEKIFVASSNKQTIYTKYGSYKTIGNEFFSDRAFDKVDYDCSLSNSMPYHEFMSFENAWGQSNNKIEQEVYKLRYDIYCKLKNMNEYLDKTRDFLKKYDKNLDEKVYKSLNKIKEKDKKEFLRSIPKARDVL